MKAFVENVELWVAREDEAFKVACEAYGKKGNEAIWPKILEIVGPKPEWVASRSTSASSPA
jgi:hypothetical protein